MINMNAHEAELIEEAVRKAGKMMLSARLVDSDIHSKEGPANFCTEYDTANQRFLISEFGTIIPEASYFGEEDTAGNTRCITDGYTFFIDPIDGTTNFMFGYDHSCVSVGLAYDAKIVAGWVYDPYTDEMYKAFRGEGAYLNGRRVNIENRGLSEGIAAFGCARYNDGGIDRMLTVVRELFMRAIAIRNGGSAALDISRVAKGSNVSYFELLLQPYDYAAASIIVEESGGKICQMDGKIITLDRPCSIIAGTEKAVSEVIEIYEKNI